VFYSRRLTQWRAKTGSDGLARSFLLKRSSLSAQGRRACPRYLAHVLQRKARVARRAYQRWVEWQRKRERQHPKWIALRLLGGDREQWGCLMYIVGKENARMDPTLDYGGGHGDTSEAYGIPQASPGTKMASAGPDWRTNPETQLRWMIDYCKARYGSVCGAAYSRRVYGTY
jgi:hypothetical protein